MNVRFACPVCEHVSRVSLAAAAAWQCPSCDHAVQLSGTTEQECPVCGNPELYKKKDFPRGLGLAILTIACLGSIIPYYFYRNWVTWTILIGSAAFDALLYVWVGDVVVCYRCQAQYRGLQGTRHRPFELGVAERYRQERLRRDQLKAKSHGGARSQAKVPELE